ncbi:hypothetical protein DRO64_08565 [Candidatus Bathyarchaeota archaeon]|nr:MAG: hypothetical protein DRO64_08565 [Candidatus Bathyarchaeota archaeon]
MSFSSPIKLSTLTTPLMDHLAYGIMQSPHGNSLKRNMWATNPLKKHKIFIKLNLVEALS